MTVTSEQRIEKLEQQIHRMRRASMLVAAAFLGGVLLCVGLLAVGRARAQSATGTKAVEATTFRLVDAQGRPCGKLDAATGSPSLSFLDSRGNVRMLLTPSSVIFTNERDSVASALSYDDGVGPSLVLIGTAGKVMATAALVPEAQWRGLSLFDSQGNVRAELSLGERGRPKLCLYDERSTIRAAVALFGDGPRIGLADGKGTTIWSAP
jgi:hypothetical protein